MLALFPEFKYSLSELLFTIAKRVAELLAEVVVVARCKSKKKNEKYPKKSYFALLSPSVYILIITRTHTVIT